MLNRLSLCLLGMFTFSCKSTQSNLQETVVNEGDSIAHLGEGIEFGPGDFIVRTTGTDPCRARNLNLIQTLDAQNKSQRSLSFGRDTVEGNFATVCLGESPVTAQIGMALDQSIRLTLGNDMQLKSIERVKTQGRELIPELIALNEIQLEKGQYFVGIRGKVDGCHDREINVSYSDNQAGKILVSPGAKLADQPEALCVRSVQYTGQVYLDLKATTTIRVDQGYVLAYVSQILETEPVGEAPVKSEVYRPGHHPLSRVMLNYAKTFGRKIQTNRDQLVTDEYEVVAGDVRILCSGTVLEDASCRYLGGRLNQVLGFAIPSTVMVQEDISLASILFAGFYLMPEESKVRYGIVVEKSQQGGKFVIEAKPIQTPGSTWKEDSIRCEFSQNASHCDFKFVAENTFGVSGF